MSDSASPDAEIPDENKTGLSRHRRLLATVVALLLLVGGVLTYQFTVANRRPPSFSRGGKFARVDDLPHAGANGLGYPYGDATQTTVTTTGAAVAAPTTVAPSSTKSTTTSSGPDLSASLPLVPRNGAYTYALDGSEGASGFGSRDFPKTMGVAVHGVDGHGDQRVFDLRMSGQHEEREILSYTPNGVAFLYEAGSITFGPMTQTSEGSYSPAMVQVPWPLAIGTTVSKTSPVTDSDGGHPRTEKWTTKIVGRETLTVLGSPHDTWVVEIQRNTTPGTSEQVDRYRKYWYDPQLGTWVKWIERFHASRDSFVKFSYNANYTATLTGFVAS